MESTTARRLSLEEAAVILFVNFLDEPPPPDEEPLTPYCNVRPKAKY